MNLIDAEKRLLAQALADALAADSGPYAAPARIEATSALMVGNYKLALDRLAIRPCAALTGHEPDHRILTWWDYAFALACRLEDAAEPTGEIMLDRAPH